MTQSAKAIPTKEGLAIINQWITFDLGRPTSTCLSNRDFVMRESQDERDSGGGTPVSRPKRNESYNTRQVR